MPRAHRGGRVGAAHDLPALVRTTLPVRGMHMVCMQSESGELAFLDARGTVSYSFASAGAGVYSPSGLGGCSTKATPRTPEENELVRVAGSGTGLILLGASSTSGEWAWDDGTVFTSESYTNWATGEPNSGSSQYLCMTTSNGLWYACPAYSGNSPSGSAGYRTDWRTCICGDQSGTYEPEWEEGGGGGMV